MTHAVRPYRPEDRAACQTVFYRAVHEGAARFYSAEERAAWAPSPPPVPFLLDMLAGQCCWVAEEGGQITGFMSLDHSGYLDMAYVLPEVMGQGVAATLYDRLKAHALEQRLPRLTTHASHLARRFFTRRGWHVTEAERVHLRGQILERFAMAINLADA